MGHGLTRMDTDTKELPEGWVWKRLGEVCEVVNGGTPKSSIKGYWNGDVNWVTPKDLGQLEGRYIKNTPRKITKLGLQKSSAKLFAPGSVILSTRAPIGHLAINLEEMSTNQGCRGIVPGSNVFAEFLYYFLFDSVEILNNLGNGATFKELSSTSLKNFEIPLPPFPEQKRIVAILDEACAAIDKAKANAEKNLANAKELFESYLNGIFDNPGDDWEEKKLGEVCEFVRGPFGGSLKKSMFKPSGYAVYEQQHAINNQFESIRYFIDENKFNEMRRFELIPGDLIMT